MRPILKRLCGIGGSATAVLNIANKSINKSPLGCSNVPETACGSPKDNSSNPAM